MRRALLFVSFLAACGRDYGEDATSSLDAGSVPIDARALDRDASDASANGFEGGVDASTPPVATCTHFVETFAQPWSFSNAGWAEPPQASYFAVSVDPKAGVFQTTTASLPFPTPKLRHTVAKGCDFKLELGLKVTGVIEGVDVTLLRLKLASGSPLLLVRSALGALEFHVGLQKFSSGTVLETGPTFHRLSLVIPADALELQATIDGTKVSVDEVGALSVEEIELGIVDVTSTDTKVRSFQVHIDGVQL